MLNSAQKILIGTAAVFITAVCGLSVYGGTFLKQVAVCDTEVCYLDLARQASDRRDYATADQMYERALNYARTHDTTGQAENAMLLTYANYALQKRNDKQLYLALRNRANELKKKTAGVHSAETH